MRQRRSLAVLVLMVMLTVAPSLALAASVCAPHCCPATAAAEPNAADPAAEDCRAGLANRSCCNETLAPVPLARPVLAEVPALVLRFPIVEPVVVAGSLPAPERRSEAQRTLRTSPLRRSVVLLI